MILWKALPLLAFALFIMKLFFATKLRAWSLALDRFVNALLVAIVIGYGVGLLLTFGH